MELELVEELRRIPARDPEHRGRTLGGEVCRPREVEAARRPGGLRGQLLEERGPALGDRVVAEAAPLDREIGRRVREVLGVARLVEQRPPVLRPADGLDHEHDAVRHLDRRAERARRLGRPLLEVELDVALAAQVDAEIAERLVERRQHLVRREGRVPLRRPERARDVPALHLVEAEPDARAEEAVGGVLEYALGRVEELSALVRETVEVELEALVQIEVRLGAELAHAALRALDRVQRDRVQVLLRQAVAHLLDPAALVAVLLVGDRRPQHPERDLLAVDLRLQLRLEAGGALGVLAGQRREEALAGEFPELAHARAAVDRGADPLRLLDVGQVGVALVDRLEVEIILQAGKVEVVLLHLLSDEMVGALAVGVELTFGRRGVRHALRIPACRRSPSRPTAAPS